jgi:hypothetical protein
MKLRKKKKIKFENMLILINKKVRKKVFFELFSKTTFLFYFLLTKPVLSIFTYKKSLSFPITILLQLSNISRKQQS